jgi:hypothetical protein
MPSLTAGQGCPVCQLGSRLRSEGNPALLGKTVGVVRVKDIGNKKVQGHGVHMEFQVVVPGFLELSHVELPKT